MAMQRDREEAQDRLAQRDNWIDKAITDAQQRGDFDDLPGQGKPLRLESNPLAPEWDTAFSVLKNAGVAPYWIELDKDIRADRAALDDLRERAAQELATRLARLSAHGGRQEQAPATSRGSQERHRRSAWWPFRRTRQTERRDGDAQQNLRFTDLEARRQQARREYLERAARLDEKIATYNASIPKELWEHERPRLPVERAAREFDDVCPPIPREA